MFVFLECDDVTRQDSFPRGLLSEDELREDLGALDFDEFQLLSSPSIGIPESVEDDFRLDYRS